MPLEVAGELKKGEEGEEGEEGEVFRVYSAVSIHQLHFEVAITFWAFHQFFGPTPHLD